MLDVTPVSASEFGSLVEGVDPALVSLPPSVFIVGVSGGADSMALCLLLSRWCLAGGHRLVAITVDHGLRPGSGEEAARVSSWLVARGIEHETLGWRGAKPASGLQAAARSARFQLLTERAASLGARGLFLAHHIQDQAETMAMRLARGSGPDGLSGIRPIQMYGNIPVLRPLLSVPPARLRAHCLDAAQIWVEDPSNRDRRFERVRIRQQAVAMTKVGLDPGRLDRLARVFGRLRDWSEKRLIEFLTTSGELDPRGFAILELSAVHGLPPPLRSKLLSGLLQSIGGLDYPPRAERMVRFFEWLDGGVRSRITLGGCLIWRGHDERLWIARETPRTIGPELLCSKRLRRWDGRFDVTWLGPQPVWIHMLTGCGERRLRLAGAVQTRGRALPAGIRTSLPAVTDLDGRLFAPHLSETWNSQPLLEDGMLRFEFRPAVPWVAVAFRVSRDDRAAMTD